MLRNTLGVMQSLYVFLEASPKRHAMFMKEASDGAFIRTLKSLSVTRWTAHESSRKGVDEELPRIIKTLNDNEISQECDAKVSSEARCLLNAILTFEFIFGLALLKIILPATSNLSSFVQSINVDVRRVKQNAELTVTTLESCRSDESFDAVWQLAEQRSEKVRDIIEEEDISIDFKEAKLPTQRKPSKRRQALIGESIDGNNDFSDLRTMFKIKKLLPCSG